MNLLSRNSGDFLNLIDDEEIKQEDSMQDAYHNV